MTIEHITYMYVEAEVPVQDAQPQEHDQETDRFLEDHFQEIQKSSRSEQTPSAFISDDDAVKLFQDLYTGREQSFMDAATKLAARLVNEMDGRTPKGLLVFLRRKNGGRRTVAVLKLQVVNEHAGILRAIANGQLKLETVENVLDAPGNIQKGISYPDPREGSDILIADKLARTGAAAYFIRAFGIEIDARPAEALLAIVKAVHANAPDLINDTVAQLPTIESGLSEDVLDDLISAVPDLQPRRAAIEETLSTNKRSIGRVNTTASLHKKIIAGSIVVKGPADDVNEYVQIAQNPELGIWETVIRSEEHPTETFEK